MPEAFGIIHKENVPYSYYEGAQIRPSTYVGWSADKMYAFLVMLYYDHIDFIEWTQYWLASGYGIQGAATKAGQWPFSTSVWTWQFKIYGYADQHFDSYNQITP